VGRFEATLQPHRNRYWRNANSDDPVAFQKQVRTICQLHQQQALLRNRSPNASGQHR